MTSERHEPEEERPHIADDAPSDLDEELAGDMPHRPASGLENEADGTDGGELGLMKDRYLRLAAEYENYRKRTEREKVEARDRAQGQIVGKLLEPLDDLQRVAQFSAESTSIEALLEGVRMVERKLLHALEAAGLEVLEARGQLFDPELHDALMTSAAGSPEEDDTVGEVFQPGYRFRGLLIRPARVQVRKHGG